MATIHLLLQGKGGVGKSFVASLLYQYLSNREGITVIGYDTDPINATFAGYKEFGVIGLSIMNGDDIEPHRFDELIGNICDLEPKEREYEGEESQWETRVNGPAENVHLVVDNGAACFAPFCSYLKSEGALEMLRADGHEIILHTVVTGGQALGDTLSGLKSLLRHFPEMPIVVWLNPYFGEITMSNQNFYNFQIYKECGAARFKGVIELPTLRPDTFGRDLKEHLARRVSFKTAVKSHLHVMSKQRLVMIERKINQAIDQANLV